MNPIVFTKGETGSPGPRIRAGLEVFRGDPETISGGPEIYPFIKTSNHQSLTFMS